MHSSIEKHKRTYAISVRIRVFLGIFPVKMSSSESEYYESDQETFSEVEDEVEVDGIGDHREDLDVLAANIDRLAYSDEPLADEEWIKNYEQQEKETAELEEQLVKRLNGSNPTSEW